MKLDHIGIVVKNLKKAQIYYKKNFGFKAITKIILEPAHKVKIQFLDFGYGTNGPVIELVSPISKKSKVYNFLVNNGGGTHHFAFFVKDINKSIKNFQKNGSIVISNIIPGAGHKKTKTIWLLGSDKSLIELIEKKKNVSFKNRLT